MRPLNPTDFVAMDWFLSGHPLSIDLAYTRANHPHNIFKTALYDAGAQLWLHKDLAKIVLRAAHRLKADHGWRLILYDGLRPVDAQIRMHDTPTVKIDNPTWGRAGNPYLSLPGEGGHPRGMAVDIGAEGIDMGTEFDDMSPQSARDFHDFAPAILANRARLEAAMVEAAAFLRLPLTPLPSEWWDFRFPRGHYEQFAPVRDAGLPPFMRLCEAHPRAIPADWQAGFDKSRADVLNAL